MAVIKCKMCGGDLNLTPGASTAECEFCGSIQTLPRADNEKKLTLFARAGRLRAACEFDTAAGIYEAIVAEFPGEAEAYWGLVLCKYGIEYVDDPATGRKIPTSHRSSFDSVFDDANYRQALEKADAVAARVYRGEGEAIEELRRGIIQVSGREDPCDIFICYKETDDRGDRTLDSVLAQDIYDHLTAKGYRVFFSRISLEDKLGKAYEPYIFAALNSAKIMLVVGTAYDHFNAVWVRNEWSRYLKLMAADKTRHLIPCFKGVDPYDMPREFAHLQALDLGKLGAMQDLLRGVEKVLGTAGGEKSPAVERAFRDQRRMELTQLEQNARTYLRLENQEEAEQTYRTITRLHPESPAGWWGLIVCQTRNFTAVCQDSEQTDVWFSYVEKLAEGEALLDMRRTYRDYLWRGIAHHTQGGARSLDKLPGISRMFGQVTALSAPEDRKYRAMEENYRDFLRRMAEIRKDREEKEINGVVMRVVKMRSALQRQLQEQQAQEQQRQMNVNAAREGWQREKESIDRLLKEAMAAERRWSVLTVASIIAAGIGFVLAVLAVLISAADLLPGGAVFLIVGILVLSKALKERKAAEGRVQDMAQARFRLDGEVQKFQTRITGEFQDYKQRLTKLQGKLRAIDLYMEQCKKYRFLPEERLIGYHWAGYCRDAGLEAEADPEVQTLRDAMAAAQVAVGPVR